MAATLTAADLQSKLNDPKVRLLDVRSPGEFAAGRIPGSHNIPLGDLSTHASALVGGAATELVLICQSGGRAGLAADVLTDAGHERHTVLAGGLNAWEQAAGAVEGASGSACSLRPTGFNRFGSRERSFLAGSRSARLNRPWSIERQVRLVAGSLVAGGVLASLKYPKARFLSGAVGGGLVFAAVSNTCMMGSVLAKLPFNRATDGDAATAVAALTT